MESTRLAVSRGDIVELKESTEKIKLINKTRKNQQNDVHRSCDQRALRRVRSAPFRSADPGVQGQCARLLRLARCCLQLGTGPYESTVGLRGILGFIQGLRGNLKSSLT